MLSSELEIDVMGETGRFWEAVVEGLRSWAGSGWCLIEADWIVEAMFAATEVIMDVLISWKCENSDERSKVVVLQVEWRKRFSRN